MVILKEAVKKTKTIRLQVTGYAQDEYYYTLSKRGLFMQSKNYRILKDKNIAA